MLEFSNIQSEYGEVSKATQQQRAQRVENAGLAAVGAGLGTGAVAGSKEMYHTINRDRHSGRTWLGNTNGKYEVHGLEHLRQATKHAMKAKRANKVAWIGTGVGLAGAGGILAADRMKNKR